MHLFRSLPVLLLSAAVLAATPALASTSLCDAISGNLIANCGFEGGSTANNGGTAPDQWNVSNWTAYDNVATPTSGTYVTISGPNSGDNYLQFSNDPSQGPAVLSQTFLDNPGDSLTFTFYADNGYPYYRAGTELLAAYFDSTQLLNDDGSNDSGSWTQYSYTVTATGLDTVSFYAYNQYDWYYLDDVSVAPSSVSATPEPSSLALLGTGLLGGAGMLRRRIARA